MKHETTYVIKYSKFNGTTPPIDHLVSKKELRELAASNGMIFETAAEFLVISDYHLKPWLFARRSDLH